MLFPHTVTVPPVYLHPRSWSALGHEFGGALTGPQIASAAWPTANLAICYPFSITDPWLVKRLWALNGSTASGNFDIAIYSRNGTRIVGSGSTAQVGTNQMQYVDVADTILSPGRYYLALVRDNTSATNHRHTFSTAWIGPTMGLRSMAAAFPLPATITLAETSLTYLPMCGATAKA
jgi:hypothetical protein